MKAPTDRPRIPPAIWALGFVSMLADIGSEMVHSLLPVFLVSVAGVSMFVGAFWILQNLWLG